MFLGGKGMIKIGDFAKIFGITVRAIRYYEEMGLLKPCYVDIYSGYRYYDEKNVEELSKILYLKDLGFSLEAIKDFDDKSIQNQYNEYQNKINEIKEKMYTLKQLSKNIEGDVYMESFVNDEKAIGKWNLIGIAKSKELYYEEKILEDKDFKIKELYLMENGEKYWTISWTKGSIIISNRKNSYEIENNKMFVKIISPMDNEDFKIAIYEKENSEKYTKEQIRIRDNINMQFEPDKEIVGFWKAIDIVMNPKEFSTEKSDEKADLFLDRISFSPDGRAVVEFNDDEHSVKNTKYTSSYIMNVLFEDTASCYKYLDENKNYIALEWKSGDYIFGGIVIGYYILKRI